MDRPAKRPRSVLSDDIEPFSSEDDIDPTSKRTIAGLSTSAKPSADLRKLARAEERVVAESRLKKRRPRDRLLGRFGVAPSAGSAGRGRGGVGSVGVRGRMSGQ